MPYYRRRAGESLIHREKIGHLFESVRSEGDDESDEGYHFQKAVVAIMQVALQEVNYSRKYITKSSLIRNGVLFGFFPLLFTRIGDE
jgi:hypothetical protein